MVRPAATGSRRARRACRAGDALGAVGRLFELGRHLGVAAGQAQIVDHRPQVQPGPPDQQGPVPPGRHLTQGGPGQALVVGDGELLVRLDQVDQVVGHLGPGHGVGLGGGDVHPPVDRHRVDREDLDAADGPGGRLGQRRLPRGGGAHQGHGGSGPVGAHRRAVSRRRPGSGYGGGAPAVTRTRLAGEVVRAPPPPRPPRRTSRATGARPTGTKCTSLALGAAAGQHRVVAPARPLHQDLFGAAHPGPVSGQRGALHHRPQPLEAVGRRPRGRRSARSTRRPGSRGGARR